MDTYARFYIHPVKDMVKAREGEVFYNDVVYAEIFIKGDKNTSFGRPKKEQDEIDYPKAWESFVNNTTLEESGISLKHLPTMSPSQIMNLNATGINTIEDLAGLADNVVIGTQGMVDLRKRAQAYLAAMDEPVEIEQPEHVSIPDKPKKKRRKRNKETGELE